MLLIRQRFEYCCPVWLVEVVYFGLGELEIYTKCASVGEQQQERLDQHVTYRYSFFVRLREIIFGGEQSP